MYTVQQISDLLGTGALKYPATAISELLTDSRKLQLPEASLFFALAGAGRKGQDFVKDLYDKKVRAFVVSKDFLEVDFPEADFLKVDDVTLALQHITAWHRAHFTLPIVGITGSNGKTIVKELLFQLLEEDFNIVRNPKSYNSQIGVPLSVWPINQNHTLGIFEAGISLQGEMQRLEPIIRPSIGIFTHIGEAHSEGFNSIQEKIEEKLKLFLHTKLLVFSYDETLIANAIAIFVKEKNHDLRTISWGKQADADVRIWQVEKLDLVCSIEYEYLDQRRRIIIPFTDDASIANCMHCCVVMLSLGISTKVIAERMKALKPIAMRLELKKGINNTSIINDTYNSDFDSLKIALQFLQQQNQHKNKTIILSDLFQTGMNTQELYSRVAKHIKSASPSHFIGVGQQLMQHQSLFDDVPTKHFFNSTSDLMQALPFLQFSNETILIKGSRQFELEQLSKRLEAQAHETVLEINLDAIRHNILYYRSQLKPGVKLMVMVKAFSYGSGGFEVANIIQQTGVDYLSVAYVDEGIALRNAGITLPIMVLNVSEDDFNILVRYQLEPELFSFALMKDFASFLEQNHIEKYAVHIKLDTGMHRLGFLESDLENLLASLKRNTAFKIASVFTHLAASEDAAHDEYTLQQAAAFERMTNAIEEVVQEPFIKHICNSSAITRFLDLQQDMVRLGIGAYGVDSNPTTQEKLQNVTTLKSTIAQIKQLPKGSSVGYGRKHFLEKDSEIAVIRIGYADGYRRSFGNGVGKVLVNGTLVKTVGNICMDMTMIDVTGIDCTEGAEVIIFGKDLPVQVLAAWAHTIPYEILTSISQRVNRLYYQD